MTDAKTLIEQLVLQLQGVGFSAYEAKAYTALVEAGRPLNGYEVAKRSGVPRSTVYEVLGKLAARRAAYEVADESDSVSYVPLSPAMLTSRFRSNMDHVVNSLESGFDLLSTPTQARLTHAISGRSDLLDRCQDVIRAARTDIFVSVWPEELDVLRTDLRRAADQGVDVSVLCFGDPGEPIGYSYQHEFSSPDQVLDNVGCRLMVVAGDREQAVIGGLDGSDTWGTYTDDAAVVAVSVEYVRHDIAMQLLMRRTSGDESIQEYWRTAKELMRLRSDHGEPAERLRQMAKARGRR